MARYRTHAVEVEITLDEFTTQELVEELQSRHALPDGVDLDKLVPLLTKIYENRILAHEYQNELDELIWQVLGRIS